MMPERRSSAHFPKGGYRIHVDLNACQFHNSCFDLPVLVPGAADGGDYALFHVGIPDLPQ